MVGFLLLAFVLTAGCVAVVTVPLLRKQAGDAPAPRAALAAAALIVVGAAGGYLAWSNWTWHAPVGGDLPQNMVARLALRLENHPDDLQGWLMLGHSYVVLEQLPLALRAYERADRLAGGKNVDAIVGMAEALALGDPGELNARAGRLIERALALDPNSGKALFYGAAAALRRGDLPSARARFAKLLALDPPANVRPILAQEIAAIDQKMAAAAPAAAPSEAAARVRVKISMQAALAAPADKSATLYVIVRDPKRPGPPLAVKRLASRFPLEVDLSPADSMMPERRFASGDQVQVVARVARSGQAMGATGDPFGEISYKVGQDGVSSVVIDRLTP